MIVVFGSVNIDLVIAAPRLPAPGETVVGDSYRLLPGGKGANQALAAARDGASVALAGAVGPDAFAEAALALLRTEGIDLSLLRVADLPTGCAAITVQPSGKNLITVAAGANRRAAAATVPDQMLGPETIVLMQMEVPVAEVALLATRAKARGSRVLLNLAPAMALDEATLRRIDVLIANEGEAAALGAAPGAVAARLGATIVVTRGARGAEAHLAEGRVIAVPALPVEVVDTTGAGDTFVGVLAAALDGGRDFAAALVRASAAAALSCRSEGAQPGMPRGAAIDDAVLRLQQVRR
jgi:ribokinase